VLQIVDAEIGRFGETDRAQVPCHLDVLRMGRRDRRGEFGAGDVHVCLERGRAFADPVVDRVGGIGRIHQLVHLRCKTALAFQIRPGGVHLRPGDLAGVDRLLQLKVGIRLGAAGGADSGDAASQIQLGKARCLLGIDRLFRFRVHLRRRVKHVVVHADQARDQRVSTAVDHRRILRHLHMLADFSDEAIAQQHRLVFPCLRTVAVNHPHMNDRQQRLRIFHELLRLRRQLRCLRHSGCGSAESRQYDGQQGMPTDVE